MAVPVVQRLVSGIELRFWPLLEPQAPLMGVLFLEAEQEAALPPLVPGQVQEVELPISGKEGEEGVEVPDWQKVSEPYDVESYV